RIQPIGALPAGSADIERDGLVPGKAPQTKDVAVRGARSRADDGLRGEPPGGRAKDESVAAEAGGGEQPACALFEAEDGVPVGRDVVDAGVSPAPVSLGKPGRSASQLVEERLHDV